MKNSILKRILSLIIILTMLPFNIAAHASDIYTEKDIKNFNDNVSLLYDFGLIEDNDREMATTVTRGEFASIMMKYLQFGNEISLGDLNNEKSFSDVYENAEDIYGIVSMGIMSGYPNGKFEPENKIVFEEALKTIVTALGWGEIAQMQGEYPKGYISMAASLGLMEDVLRGQGEILTYFDLVQILVNALSAELYVERDSDTDAGRKSWLSSILKADIRYGTVTYYDDETNRIVIDNEAYNSENDYTDMQGCRVEFYIDRDDNVIYVGDESKDRVEIDAFLIDDYAGKTYSIYTNEMMSKTQKYELSQNVNIIYNGVMADSLSLEDMVPEYGKVTFINNNSDKLYESVLIESYQIYSVISADADNRTLICKNCEGSTETIDLADIGDGSIDIVNASGKPMSLGDIPAEAVLRVGFSADKTNVKIIVSEKVVNGTILSLEDDDDYVRVNIDGVEYRTVSNFYDSSKLKTGISGQFYLDSENIIAGVKFQKTGWLYGYLITAYFKDGDDENLFLNIFDASEEVVSLGCVKKIKIDGLSGKKGKEVERILKAGDTKVKKRMIRYKLNDKDLITEIDTPYNSIENMEAEPQNGESPDSLRLVFAKTNAHYSKALYSFEGKINVARTTPVFNIPGDDTEKYHVRAASVFANDKRYGIEAYSDSENSDEPCFLYMATNLNANDDDTVGIITKVVTTIDDDEENYTKFSIDTYTGQGEYYYEYEDDETPVELSVGDIITFKYDDEYAHGVKLIYDYETKTLPSGNVSGSFGTSQLHYMFGRVYSKGNESISITTADIVNGAELSSGQTESVYAPVFKIFKCNETGDGGRPIIEEGTIDDIIDYKNGRDNCSEVFISTDWQWPRIIVIY